MTAQMLRISVDLTQPADAVTKIPILAKRGIGKIHTALALVEKLLGAGAQSIIADSGGVCLGAAGGRQGSQVQPHHIPALEP